MPANWRDELRRSFELSGEPSSLEAYAWPGGYQMLYYVDGDAVCPKCIMEVLRETYMTGSEDILRDIFYEGAPEVCSHCNEEVESAYGDPDAPEEEVA
jgi:hypothetical protein